VGSGQDVKPGRNTSRIGRRRLRRATVLAAGLVTIASIVGYVALSFTVNGLPAYPAAGWVSVLQPATASNADTVQLLVQARTQGGQTRAAYDVVVCGPQPYSGDLLIGGSAQLTAARPDSPLPVSPAPQIQRIPDLAFYYGGVVDLGAVQLVRISLPDVSACLPAEAVQSAGILPGGSDEGVSGVTLGPVQQSWSGPWGLWHGPHAAQAWPLTGALPGVPVNVVGEYPAVSGLSGSWSRPLQEYVQVTADAVPVTWTVDSAVPSASGPYALTWQGRNPVSPVVRLTDAPPPRCSRTGWSSSLWHSGSPGRCWQACCSNGSVVLPGTTPPRSAPQRLRTGGFAVAARRIQEPFPRECGPGGSR
jgi:hypothetical protein